MRLGHMSEWEMIVLSQRGLLEGHRIEKLDFYDHCNMGSQRRVKFNTTVHRTLEIVGCVHSDLWGPSPVPSKGGARYVLSFVDDVLRKVWICLLKHKSEVLGRFKSWKTMIEKQIGRKIMCLRTGKGLEFCSDEFGQFCAEECVVRHRTIANTPQLNGVAELMNRIILERAYSLLSNAGLDEDF